MLAAQNFLWHEESGFTYTDGKACLNDPDIVFYFTTNDIANRLDIWRIMQQQYPNAILCGCSSSAPICNADLYENAVTGMALHFEKTRLRTWQSSCPQQSDSHAAGKAMVDALLADDLAHIFVIADGLSIHGSQFLSGANCSLPEGVCISGGLASDNFEFKETLSGIDKAPAPHQICAIAFYGDAIRVGCSAESGWEKFGPKRTITRSHGNVIYELDNKPAYSLYKDYLGPEYAGQLPGSGLRFPLGIQENEESDLIIRSIDGILEQDKALHFNGDIPTGYISWFMSGQLETFAAGASKAATQARASVPDVPQAALLVSCLGRQLIMGASVIYELDAINEVLTDAVPVAGFHSAGEFSQEKQSCRSIFQTQTMTVTLLAEL